MVNCYKANRLVVTHHYFKSSIKQPVLQEDSERDKQGSWEEDSTFGVFYGLVTPDC
jgi:hypothetical protein